MRCEELDRRHWVTDFTISIFTAYSLSIFPTPNLHMRSPHRVFIPSCSISKSRQNTTRRCEVSFIPHLSDTRTHNTTSKDPLYSPSRRSRPSSSPPFPPYPKRLLHSNPASSALRFHPPKAGPLTCAMPTGRKGKGDSREVEISKSLSYLLRHGAKSAGIQLDGGGWANVAEVVGFCGSSFCTEYVVFV